MVRDARPPPARLGLFLGVLGVSWGAILVRLADAPALSVAAWRVSLASVPVVALALWLRRAELSALDRRARWQLLAAGFALALHFASWIASLGLTSVASSVVLVTSHPLWVVLLERVFFRQGPSRRQLLGIGVSLGGTALIAGADLELSGRALLGDGLALLGALCAAVYFVLGRSVRPRLSLLGYVGTVYPASAAVLLVMVVLAGQPLVGFSPTTWLWLGLAALVPQLLGHSALNWSLRYLPATAISIAILGEPVGATVLAALLLGELPGSLQLGGAALILAGVALASTAAAEPSATGPDQEPGLEGREPDGAPAARGR